MFVRQCINCIFFNCNSRPHKNKNSPFFSRKKIISTFQNLIRFEGLFRCIQRCSNEKFLVSIAIPWIDITIWKIDNLKNNLNKKIFIQTCLNIFFSNNIPEIHGHYMPTFIYITPKRKLSEFAILPKWSFPI